MEKVEETKVQEPPPPVSGVGRDKRSRPSTAFAFTVHVESFRERAKAESRVKALQDLGLEAFTVRAELTGKGPYYRILVGRFADRAQANAHLDRLQKEHGLPQGRVLAASEVAR
jgi:cell division septation protein DedD